MKPITKSERKEPPQGTLGRAIVIVRNILTTGRVSVEEAERLNALLEKLEQDLEVIKPF